MWFDLAEIIRFHRKQAGLSQNELADMAGIGKTAVFDLEKGRVSARLETVQKVLRVLNIEVEFQSPMMNQYLANKEPS